MYRQYPICLRTSNYERRRPGSKEYWIELRQSRLGLRQMRIAVFYSFANNLGKFYFCPLYIHSNQPQVPSTINRVYSLVHAGEVSFALSYIESLVLPLQGFWNAVIYIATSIPACKATWNKVCGRVTVRDFALSDMRNIRREGKRLGKSESMTELATD